jgi:hypothetical protein
MDSHPGIKKDIKELNTFKYSETGKWPVSLFCFLHIQTHYERKKAKGVVAKGNNVIKCEYYLFNVCALRSIGSLEAGKRSKFSNLTSTVG